MGRIILWLGAAAAAILAVLVLGTGFLLGWPVLFGPKARPTSAVRFESTPERRARGEYLVMGVLACMHCHSEPGDGDKPGAGFRMAAAPNGLKPVAPNITPDRETGIGSWTDDQIARAIREGVRSDGAALHPMMPYEVYRLLSDEDVAAVVVFLRSIPAVRREMPRMDPGFPVRYLIRNFPQPLNQPVAYDFQTTVERGKHLSQVGGCVICHTPHDEKHAPLPGMEFAGGDVMTEMGDPAVPSNLTPDASGIGGYTRDQFRRALRTGNTGSRQLNPLMPYSVYARMTTEDIDAIYDYLRTVKPVKHWVNGTGTVRCPVCNHPHGLAEMNLIDQAH